MTRSNILSLGSFVVDLMCRTPHLPAPGETVFAGPFRMGPGGKGSNQAIAARRAGANILFSTRIGKDEFGALARRTFEENNLSTGLVFEDPQHETGAALIMVEDAGQNMITVSTGACGHYTEGEVRRAMAEADRARYFLTQLETNLDAALLAIRLAKAAGLTVVVNPAPVQALPEEIYAAIDYLTPNEHEASQLTGVPVTDADSAAKAAARFIEAGVKTVLVTLGAKGVLAMEKDGTRTFLPAFKVDAVDTTGAGDAFNGGFIAALAEGQSLLDAARFGCATAALSVTRIGTAPAMPTRSEIDAFLTQAK